MHGGLLSGQNRLPEWIREFAQPREILEIGCRTGTNLTLLAKAFPEAKLTGVDTSSALLSKARQRLGCEIEERTNLLKVSADEPFCQNNDQFDLILCSYSLSRMGPLRYQCIQDARAHLKPDGHLLVLDFLDTPFRWFRHWIHTNHFTLDPKLLAACVCEHPPLMFQKHRAYFGLYTYFIFVGSKSLPRRVKENPWSDPE